MSLDAHATTGPAGPMLPEPLRVRSLRRETAVGDGGHALAGDDPDGGLDDRVADAL